MPKKIPAYLKGLVETRARAHGDLLRYEEFVAEVTAKITAAKAEIEACDRLIRKFDERLDPTLIEPVRSHHRYGGRGRLRAALLEYLKSVYPSEATTTEIAIEVQLRFGLDFATAEQRDEWVRGSMARAVRELMRQGHVERMHDPSVRTGDPGRWRWNAMDSQADEIVRQMAEVGEEISANDASGGPAQHDPPDSR